jgi:hypothetical protein
MTSRLLAQIYNPVLQQQLGGQNTSGGDALAELMARLFRTAVVVGGLALLLYLAWGGISWITAGGDDGKLKEAKTRIENAIMGMAVLAGTIAIAVLLQFTFGFDLLAPNLNFGAAGGGGGSTPPTCASVGQSCATTSCCSPLNCRSGACYP